ncbi:hypothetical protein T4E_2943 [Trichinella pseudospiralis]|uniref:Uncharacterized protein n=1 Tax=Trichinella pseudospiralis TaxID=6337 RepID=A0A0V0XGB2_TRIPS|nr:hypothetical protein T4E_2943 [Trichinella pseudospiralis]
MVTATVRNTRIRNCPLMKPEKHVHIAEPNIIRQCNQYMGGVDVMDKMISSYQYQYNDKIKKVVMEFIFVCVEYGRSGCVAWKLHTQLHTATNDQLSHLELLREFHHLFIAREAIDKKPPGATGTLINKHPDIVRTTLPAIMCPRAINQMQAIPYRVAGESLIFLMNCTPPEIFEVLKVASVCRMQLESSKMDFPELKGT